MRAVEYGEMVQKDGKWVFRSNGRPDIQTHAHEGADHERGILKSFSTKGKRLGSNPPMRSSIYGETSNGADM